MEKIGAGDQLAPASADTGARPEEGPDATAGAVELAEMYGINLEETEIDGSGPNGRIYKQDIEKYIEDNKLSPV